MCPAHRQSLNRQSQLPMPTPTHFGDSLAEAVKQCGNPVLVGLDPRWESLPDSLRNSNDAGVKTRATAYEAFCKEVVDVVATLVPAVKVQSAFFEELGPPGLAALAEVINHAQRRGLLVIFDGKRNDIGSTAEAYARAYLGRDVSAWHADALTVSPYLGDDSLTPFVDIATQRGAGVFVLVKTSNPGGGLFQDVVADGAPMYRHVARHVEELATATTGGCGYGSVGAVVGATYPDQLSELRTAMPHTWFLVPGFGSQGGTAKDVASGFDESGLGAIVNSSRGIIFAHSRAEYAKQFAANDWQRAVEAATLEMIAGLSNETPAGRLRKS
jgi:orotidine-5'-phosphate decarboxylase